MPNQHSNGVISNFLDLIGLDVASPVAGRVRLFAKKIAERLSLTFRDENSTEYTLGLHEALHRYTLWSHPGNSNAAITPLGGAAPVAQGTATARNVAVTNVVTRRRRLGYVSAATANAMCGHYNSVAQDFVGNGAVGGFHYMCKFNVADAAAVAGARQFVGLRNIVTAPTNIEPSTMTNCIGAAKLSTSNNLHLVFGGSAAQAPIDFGANFPANDNASAYTLILYSNKKLSSTITYTLIREGTAFSVTGTIVGTSLNLPTPTTLLAHAAWRTNNATLLAVALDIERYYIGEL